jgi:hypothetical protein
MKKLFVLIFMFTCLQAGEIEFKATDREIECMETILYSLSEKSTTALLFDAFHLRALGKEMDKIPPLEFLYYVMQRSDLTSYIKNTRKRYFQWNAFISGFNDKCNQPSVYLQIKDSLGSFAKLVNIEENLLLEFVENRKWQQLVEYLLIRRN